VNLETFTEAWLDLAECQFRDKSGNLGRLVQIDYFKGQGYFAEVKFPSIYSEWYRWSDGSVFACRRPHGYGSGITPPGCSL
jgi:hypothetical protein